MIPGINHPDSIVERLTKHGFRLTASRRAVVETVLDGEDNFSAEGLVRALPAVGRATIYRTLKLLVDIDALCRVMLEDGSVRYRLSRRPEHHHHLVCTGCGEMTDFAGCGLESLSSELRRRTSYEITGHRLELYGLCPDCRDQEAPP